MITALPGSHRLQTCIALLRGINVGGRNMLPMATLKNLLSDVGCKNIQTYIQSGNAVFDYALKKPEMLARKISSAINQRCRFSPDVQVLTDTQWHLAIDANPYRSVAAEDKNVHFSFLSTTPENPGLDELESLRAGNEAFALIGRVFYLHAPDGIARSKLAVQVEKQLGVPATSRNQRTVHKILSMLAART